MIDPASKEEGRSIIILPSNIKLPRKPDGSLDVEAIKKSLVNRIPSVKVIQKVPVETQLDTKVPLVLPKACQVMKEVKANNGAHDTRENKTVLNAVPFDVKSLNSHSDELPLPPPLTLKGIHDLDHSRIPTLPVAIKNFGKTAQSPQLHHSGTSVASTKTLDRHAKRVSVKSLPLEEKKQRKLDQINRAVNVFRSKQKEIKAAEFVTLVNLESKKEELIQSILKIHKFFPEESIPKFIGLPIPEEIETRTSKQRIKLRSMPETEKKVRKMQINRLSASRKVRREKVFGYNRKGRIVFLERQVKYLEAILKVLRNRDKKDEKTVVLEYEVLKRLLLTPKFQTPDPLPEKVLSSKIGRPVTVGIKDMQELQEFVSQQSQRWS